MGTVWVLTKTIKREVPGEYGIWETYHDFMGLFSSCDLANSWATNNLPRNVKFDITGYDIDERVLDSIRELENQTKNANKAVEKYQKLLSGGEKFLD